MRPSRLSLLTRVLALILVLSLASVLGATPPQALAQSSLDPKATSDVGQPLRMEQIPVEVRTKIDPFLLRQLLEAQENSQQRGHAQSAPVTSLVYLREQAPTADLRSAPDGQNRRAQVVSRLQTTAERSQSGILAFLEKQSSEGKVTRFKSYWVYNGLSVDADLQTVVQLAARSDVASVRANNVHRLPAPDSLVASTGEDVWGISRIGADRVWQALGVTGVGVVVANLDSGVDWLHPALQRKYRGYNPTDPAASVHDYNWFDATATYPLAPGPNRPHISVYSVHGTHTMGTMVGSSPDGLEMIGVAPDARWVAVKVFDDEGYATDENIHVGFQWCLAPTDLRGQNPDPSKAPDIVSNSWGDSDGQSDTFRQDVIALRAAGILTTFSAGNDGPEPATVGSPASFPNAFAVGASDALDRIASFSSRGPSPWGQIKPDVVAPGVDIRSSIPGGTYAGGWNGTSMAAPHAAGLMALLLQADRELSVAATEYAITSTCLDLSIPGKDNSFGYGRIDAYQAVASVIRGGTIAGYVTDQATRQPLADVQITMRGRETGRESSARTDADGHYTASAAEGLYDVSATKFGYEGSSVCTIQVLAQTTTQLDFALRPRPSGAVAGRVMLTGGAMPVTAMVSMLGTPMKTSTDAQGYYSFTAPVGVYALRALPTEVGYRGAEAEGVAVAQNRVTTVDFAVSVAPRVLLVDADARSAGYLSFYEAGLSALLLSHRSSAILNPPVDIPTAAELGQYDVVIWSQPSSSPGYIGAWSALKGYLDRGGSLLISGQNVGYWDKDLSEYRDYLHARYVSDDAGLDPITGTPGEILDALRLSYNTLDSASNQLTPDAIAAGDLYAQPIFGVQQDATVGLRSDACAHRTVYLSFGLEGTGPGATRQEVLSRLLTWLSAARPPRGVSVSATAPSQAAAIGGTARYNVYVVNDGQAIDRYDLSVDSPLWAARLLDATNGEAITRTAEVAPCQAVTLRLEVSVAISATTNQTGTATVIARSANSPSVVATRAVRVTASPVWGQGPDLPVPRYRLAGAADGCAVYAIAGLLDDSAGTAVSRVDILSLRSGTWSSGAPKPMPAGNSAVAQIDGSIYVLGGYDAATASKYLSTVEVYDTANDTWRSAPSLSQALSGPAATAFSGRVYVFGGSTADGPSRVGYVLDPAVGLWRQTAPPPADDLSFAAAATLGDAIYVAGGWPNQTALLRYSPATDSWTQLAPMLVGRHSFAMIAGAGALYVAGGGDNWSGLTSAERYDPATNSWMLLLPLANDRRAGTSGAYADGRFYVLGGVGNGTTPVVEYLDIGTPLQGSYLVVDKPVSAVGDALSYSLLVRNSATQPITAQWSHRLPDELEYVAGSATGGAQYDAATRSLRWSGSVPALGSVSFAFVGTMGAQVRNGTIVTSTVYLEGGGCAPHELQALTLMSMPTLERSSKIADAQQVVPGARLHYAINVANGTSYTIGQASLVDPIPAHTAFVPGSLTGATYNAAANRIEWQGSLPPAEAAGRAFNWIDATSGHRLSLTDDSCSGPLPLGFAFEFYGSQYADVYVNSNGMVLFSGCSSAFSNGAIPSPAEPNNFVAPFWDDLTPGAGAVYLASFGSAPHRFAVVEWHEVTFYGQSQPQTFEVLLYEGTNSVVFQYLALSGDRGGGSSATVGIENQAGTLGIQYLYDGSPAEHALRSQTVLEMPHSSTRNAATRLIEYAVLVDSVLPPLSIITNTAWISDGLFTHLRTVTTSVSSPSLANSTMRVEPARALAGDLLTYTVEIINSGQYTASDVMLVDPLPAGVVTGTLRVLSGSAIYNQAANAVEWRGDVPPSGQSALVSFQVALADVLPVNFWITNSAAISVQGVPMSSPAAGVLVNEINLATSNKSAHTADVPAGSTVTYTIVLRNSGLLATDHAAMSDTLAAELTLVAGTLEGGAYDSAARTITWQGTVAPGGQHLVRYRAAVQPNVPDGALVANSVLIDDGHGYSDVRRATIRVLRANLANSDASVSPEWLAPGGVVTYTLRLRNTGEIDTAATLSCTVPQPLVLIPNGACASSGSIAATGQTVNWHGSILAHGMVQVQVALTTLPTTPRGQATLEAVLADSGGIEKRLAATVLLGNAPVFLPMVRR